MQINHITAPASVCVDNSKSNNARPSQRRDRVHNLFFSATNIYCVNTCLHPPLISPSPRLVFAPRLGFDVTGPLLVPHLVAHRSPPRLRLLLLAIFLSSLAESLASHPASRLLTLPLVRSLLLFPRVDTQVLIILQHPRVGVYLSDPLHILTEYAVSVSARSWKYSTGVWPPGPR